LRARRRAKTIAKKRKNERAAVSSWVKAGREYRREMKEDKAGKGAEAIDRRSVKTRKLKRLLAHSECGHDLAGTHLHLPPFSLTLSLSLSLSRGRDEERSGSLRRQRRDKTGGRERDDSRRGR
jgi:hypothetical protein